MTLPGPLRALGAALILGILAAQPLAAEEAVPDFSARLVDDTVALRIDTVPDLPGQEYLSTEYSLDGGPAKAIPRDAHEDQRLVFLPAEGRPGEIRLRGRYLADGKVTTGAWSAVQPVTPGPAAKAKPAAFAPEDWEIGTDPDRMNALRIRLNRLPVADSLSVSLQRSPRQVIADLIPETGIWQSVPLDPGEIMPGQIETYAVLATTERRAGPAARWSTPKPAAGGWAASAPVMAPRAPLPWSWFLRPSGIAGEALVEIAEPLPLRGSPVTGIEARWAVTDALFAPVGGWGGWQALKGAPAPDGQGLFHLTGLPDGVNTVVEIRAISAAGPGLAAARKQIVTRTFTLPQQAVFGALNPAGSGGVRVEKDAVIETVLAGSPADWRIVPGGESPWDYLTPAVAGDRLSPARLQLSGGHTVEASIAPATFTAATADDIRAFLALDPAIKSGATLLAGPEWIDLSKERRAFRSAFSNLSAPVTMRPREPENGTLISNWLISEGEAGVSAGRLHVEDVTFFSPLVQNLAAVFDLVGNGDFNDIMLDRVKVFSDLMPLRLGGDYRTSQQTRGVKLTYARNVVLRDSEVAFIVYGVGAGSQDAIQTGNYTHHLAADGFNLHFRKGTAEAPTLLKNVLIENNTESDHMGDTWRLHPDGLHMWMIATGSAPDFTRIENLSYSGNVSFPGREGAMAPPVAPMDYGAHGISTDHAVRAADDRYYLRVDASEGPVTITLPPLEQTPLMQRRAEWPMEFAVQKIDQSDNPVHIRRAGGPGQRDSFTGDITKDTDLTQPFRTLVFYADPEKRHWRVRAPGPALQGFYADPNDVPLPGLRVEGNVLWGTAPNQIFPQNMPQMGAEVRHNTVLPSWPGDTDRDGVYNSGPDGAGRFSLWVRLRAGDGTVNVWGNLAHMVEEQPVSKTSPPSPADPVIWGNEAFDARGTAWLEKQFPDLRREFPARPESLIWFPTAREEAIAMARPAPGSEVALGGFGALGPTPDTDWWDYQTGKRNPKALPQLAVTALAPSGETGAGVPALELTANLPLRHPAGHALNAPKGEGSRPIRLIEAATGQEVQAWDLSADPGPGLFDVAGPRLRLALAAALKPDTAYRVELGPDTLVDLFGQRIEPAGTVPDWQFRTAP